MDSAEKITLFCFLLQGVCCRDFNISLPKNIQALSGSCVFINCSFEIKEEYDKDLNETNATGAWYKDDHSKNVVFNSSYSNPKNFNGTIIGKLHEKNCTTIFNNVSLSHSGNYYFRILSGRLAYSYTINSSTINVTESPVSPRLQLYEEQKEVQDQQVLEGRSVSLRCSAETLCSFPPPTLTWSSTPRIPLSESRRGQELISDLNFTAAQSHHRVTFICTITYQLQEHNKTAHSNITLHVQYAPKISSSSSCNGTAVIVCFCDVDGNPSPQVEWHLSGRPVSNSSNIWISEERLNSTDLRSFITLHQSLTNTSTLVCVANNTHGSQRIQLIFYVGDSNLSSVLIGVAVVSLLTAILSVITYTYVRKKNKPRQEDAVRNYSTNEENNIYANKDMLASAGATTVNQETLIYSSIDFTNCNPRSREVESDPSPDVHYAVVQHRPKGAREAQVTVSPNMLKKPRESKEPSDSSQIYAMVKPRKP